MPLYEYTCPCGRSRDELVARLEDAPSTLTCECGRRLRRQFPCPQFRMSGEVNWTGATMGDVWGDSPLGEMDDGVNPLKYKSDKIQMDMGVK